MSLKSLFCRSVTIPQILLHTNSSADISISENSKSCISGLEPLKVLPFPVWNISDHPQKWRAFKSHHRDAEIVTWKLLSLWTCKSCFPVHQNSPRYPASMEKVKGFWNYVLVFRLFFSEQKFLTVYKNGNFNTVNIISNSHLCIYELYSIDSSEIGVVSSTKMYSYYSRWGWGQHTPPKICFKVFVFERDNKYILSTIPLLQGNSFLYHSFKEILIPPWVCVMFLLFIKDIHALFKMRL